MVVSLESTPDQKAHHQTVSSEAEKRLPEAPAGFWGRHSLPLKAQNDPPRGLEMSS